mmetsp:Transcript_42216/g.99018  ORF Transcript_42216/g.99018 Transcript_42216/m.99018 type:complete len:201 (-) Transcript_42216:55-657(-)
MLEVGDERSLPNKIPPSIKAQELLPDGVISHFRENRVEQECTSAVLVRLSVPVLECERDCVLSQAFQCRVDHTAPWNRHVVHHISLHLFHVFDGQLALGRLGQQRPLDVTRPPAPHVEVHNTSRLALDIFCVVSLHVVVCGDEDPTVWVVDADECGGVDKAAPPVRLVPTDTGEKAIPPATSHRGSSCLLIDDVVVRISS